MRASPFLPDHDKIESVQKKLKRTRNINPVLRLSVLLPTCHTLRILLSNISRAKFNDTPRPHHRPQPKSTQHYLTLPSPPDEAPVSVSEERIFPETFGLLFHGNFEREARVSEHALGSFRSPVISVKSIKNVTRASDFFPASNYYSTVVVIEVVSEQFLNSSHGQLLAVSSPIRYVGSHCEWRKMSVDREQAELSRSSCAHTPLFVYLLNRIAPAV